MADITGSFDTAANQNATLIRKALKGTVLLGKYDTAPIITSLVASGGQIKYPDSYKGVGWISEDGLTFSKNREVVDVRGWGSASFLRRDIQSEDNTMQFAALETSRITAELRTNLDLSAVQMSAAGELKYDLPDRPDTVYWRALALGVDGVGASLFYMAKVWHRCTVTDMDDETWTDGDDPLMTNVTMSALVDDAAGSIGTEFLFGPGAKAAAVAMGWTVASA